jgi:hypothetical protein
MSSDMEELAREGMRQFTAPLQVSPDLAARACERHRRRARRRISGAVSGLAVVAATVVLSLGLSGAFGSAPAHDTGTIRTAAFTLAEHADGTATLTINPYVLVDPRALQRDLRQDGIPALVTVGSFCSSQPIPSGFTQVVSGPSGPPPSYTINPAAMPAGTELSFDNFNVPNPPAYRNGPLRIETVMELIDTNSYTCTHALPEPWPPPYGKAAFVEVLPGGGIVMGTGPAGS